MGQRRRASLVKSLRSARNRKLSTPGDSSSFYSQANTSKFGWLALIVTFDEYFEFFILLLIKEKYFIEKLSRSYFVKGLFNIQSNVEVQIQHWELFHLM